MRKFVFGILQSSATPWTNDIDFAIEHSPIYDKDQGDYVSTIGFDVEGALNLFGANKIADALEGKEIRTKKSIDALLDFLDGNYEVV